MQEENTPSLGHSDITRLLVNNSRLLSLLITAPPPLSKRSFDPTCNLPLLALHSNTILRIFYIILRTKISYFAQNPHLGI